MKSSTNQKHEYLKGVENKDIQKVRVQIIRTGKLPGGGHKRVILKINKKTIHDKTQ